jgi:hypothetical protein
MKEKHLGKITHAEFGLIEDYPFLIGLQLHFSGSFGGIGDGGKYTVNLNHEAWEKSGESLSDALVERLKHIQEIFKDAKCNTISQLIGKPVEITIENMTFKEFRILTEVL